MELPNARPKTTIDPVARLLRSWRSNPAIAANIAVWEYSPPLYPHESPFPVQMDVRLEKALISLGISELFSHQAKAWELIHSGKNIIVVTGTASGKSLCYNLPVLNRLIVHPGSRALYLFPTKALTQDQAASLEKIIRLLSTGLPDSDLTSNSNKIPIAIYDGDTPTHHRSALRSKARIILSNPDMLHLGILPHHTNWADFMSHLEFVIIDEAHMYRGVFGSHVANVLRRLRRIASSYGSEPQFILTSATIANPLELGKWLVENEIFLIDENGARRGKKNFMIYNPPIVDPDLGLRRSAFQEGINLAQDLYQYGIQTIIFGQSRRGVELMLTYLREKLASHNPHKILHNILDLIPQQDTSLIEQKIRGYRSGYLPEQRREIELGLRQGVVRTVIATNALELGIDIGEMGASILVGYPGTIAATRQQSGRSGRGENESLAILIATANPLDQYLVNHPDFILKGSPEHALVNPDHVLILIEHIRCAAFELPFKTGDGFGSLSPEKLGEFLDFLVSQKILHLSGGRYFWMADQYPAQLVSLRSTSPDNVELITRLEERTISIGSVDHSSALWMVHPNAIYLHEGEIFQVSNLDLHQNRAWLERINSEYYTIPKQNISVELVQKLTQEETRGVTKYFGEIQVTSQVTGFNKLRWYTQEIMGTEPLEMPPSDLLTTGYWIVLNQATLDELRSQGIWKSDKNNYGPNWQNQRDLARKRDGYTCQVCGLSEKERSHDVHHKTPFRSFSSSVLANGLDNLVTLCHNCHRQVELAVRVRSGLAGLAYVLGHLAPFYLMCDTQDLGVTSDSQSPFAEGQPVVIVYDKVPAGLGFSQKLFELHDQLMVSAHDLVLSCACNDGCPSCVGPGGENGAGSKQETEAILKLLVPTHG